jgi:hypothetical protein
MEDRLMKPKELVPGLETSTDWVCRHWKAFPFTVKPYAWQLRFSQRGLE